MFTSQQYAQVASQARAAKKTAEDDEQSQVFGKAWCSMLTASRHAYLVSRFEAQAAAERANAALYGSIPGRNRQSERSRVRAAELYQIAQNHKKAAEERQEEGEKTLQDAGLDLNKKPNGNGKKPLGEPQQQARPDAQIDQQVTRDQAGTAVSDRPTADENLSGQYTEQPAQDPAPNASEQPSG